MRERVHSFGPARHLVGVHTAPAVAGDAPTVVYLNAGLLHRVGPYGLYVDLARDLSQLGFPGFRCDMTGVGDSALTSTGPSGDERFVADICEALDFLASEYRASRFVLLGLCSGADFAHVGAVRDPRVVGGVLLDGYGYPTPGFYLRYYAPRLANPRRLARFALRQLRRALGPARFDNPEPVDVFARKFPPRERVAAELDALLRRGVRLYCVYTGGQPYYNYRNQFRDMFPAVNLGARVQVEFLAEMDHTLTLLDDRARVRRKIREWLVQHFAVTPRPAPSEPEATDAAESDTDPAPDDTESFVF